MSVLPTPEYSRNMRLIGHSDQGGRPDGVQLMVHRGFAYIGHMVSQGFSVVDVRDPKNPRTVNYIAAPPGTWNVHLQAHDDLLLVINARDLFVRRLQLQGIGVVFISHRIHELNAVCDTLTVLRDGRLIESGPMADLSGEQIVEKMLGHELSDIFPPKRPPHSDEVLLQVEGLHDEGLLQDISLRLRKGEILGIAGLAGAGKTELCKALFGASKSRLTRGELNSQPWRPRDPADSVARGLALVPEERRKEGIFIEEPVAMNLAVSADSSFSRWSLFGHRQAWRWAEEVIARVGIRTSGPAQTLRRLSGGNQQKVAIGKWLRGNANVLIFDEPTKGVDVKAKTDLFNVIDGLAREGKGVIYASGEFSELVGLCDRICVLWDGRIVAEIPGAEAREENILYYSTGGAAA
ncbi:ATP-binding cassette domain-containing protein, partial [Klebsiella grimontii]